MGSLVGTTNHVIYVLEVSDAIGACGPGCYDRAGTMTKYWAFARGGAWRAPSRSVSSSGERSLIETTAGSA